MPKKTSFFSKKLISWYLTNKRDLPWRSTSNPYFIWLSEIILQQTRVAQGLPYYLQFIRTFPTIEQLAAAPEEKILKLWQGLGYYSRARNMHFTAKYIVNTLNGEFPATSQGLMQLKGVGDYTASAIASICYNEPAAVVDGNVYRVLSRVFGIFTPINEGRGIKEFKSLAQELIDTQKPGRYNQAVMEFGARYCVPQNPDCEGCIFNDSCEAFRLKKVNELPVKSKRLKIKKRYFNYMVAVSADNKTVLQQRKGKGIWQQLYEFPLIEQPSEVDIEQLKQSREFQAFSASYCAEDLSLYNETPIVHKLSHQHLHTRFWIVEVSDLKEKGIPVSEVSRFAVPVLIQNFISDFSQWNH